MNHLLMSRASYSVNKKIYGKRKDDGAACLISFVGKISFNRSIRILMNEMAI